MDVGPGDWVEFFRGFKGRAVPSWSPIELGQIYRVRELLDTNDDFGRGSVPGCLLENVDHDPLKRGVEGVFPLECFRPVYRPDESLIARLLEPTDVTDPA